MPKRTMKALFVGLALLLLPSRAHAIDLAAPCDAPHVFAGAAVNVVVLP